MNQIYLWQRFFAWNFQYFPELDLPWTFAVHNAQLNWNQHSRRTQKAFINQTDFLLPGPITKKKCKRKLFSVGVMKSKEKWKRNVITTLLFWSFKWKRKRKWKKKISPLGKKLNFFTTSINISSYNNISCIITIWIPSYVSQ